jgi:Ser/Thr protein kinase RdoA (MazF antagonist)
MEVGRMGNVDLDRVTDEFGLGEPLEAEELTGGAASTLKLRTARGTFVVKRVTDTRELALYRQVEVTLNRAGVRQARVHTTLAGDLAASTGQAVFEWLPGRWATSPTHAQSAALMRHFAAYNRAIRAIHVPPFVTAWDNPWRKADALDYLFRHLPAHLTRLPLSPAFVAAATAALRLLAEWRAELEHLPKQLVHGDVGPGNVLYTPDHRAVIIDFTPYDEPHLYGVCVALYWHYVYPTNGQPDIERIGQDLATYATRHLLTVEDKRLFPVIFAKVATRILTVPLLLHLEHGQPLHVGECDARATALTALLACHSSLVSAIGEA